MSNAGGWLPIETAPKDGTEILGLWDGDRVGKCSWRQAYWYDMPNDNEVNHPVTWVDAKGAPCDLTHWLPMPAYPTEGK